MSLHDIVMAGRPASRRAWRAHGGVFRLQAAEVEVWRADLDAVTDPIVAALRQLLSEDEEQRARSFFFDRDRRRFIVGRGVLRTLLSGYLDRLPAAIAFVYGPNGKPALAPDAGAEASALEFNVAHSESLALFAFTRSGPVGVDAERVRDLPDWEDIAASCFAPAEQARLAAAAPELRREEFFRAWTRQEALLKATGVGLGAMPPREAWLPDGATDPSNPPFCATPASNVRVYPLQAGDGFAAAIAVGPAARRLSTFNWNTPATFKPCPDDRGCDHAPLG